MRRGKDGLISLGEIKDSDELLRRRNRLNHLRSEQLRLLIYYIIAAISIIGLKKLEIGTRSDSTIILLASIILILFISVITLGIGVFVVIISFELGFQESKLNKLKSSKSNIYAAWLLENAKKKIDKLNKKSKDSDRKEIISILKGTEKIVSGLYRRYKWKNKKLDEKLSQHFDSVKEDIGNWRDIIAYNYDEEGIKNVSDQIKNIIGILELERWSELRKAAPEQKNKVNILEKFVNSVGFLEKNKQAGEYFYSTLRVITYIIVILFVLKLTGLSASEVIDVIKVARGQ